MLRVSLGQINPTIGDITGNIALMLDAARQARDERSYLVVFPELSLTGYYPGDLLDDPLFLGRVDAGLQQLKLATRETPGLYWVVGAPIRREGPGKCLTNSLLVMHNGQVLLHYAKQLLPTYNVHDERRHFEPGPDVAKVLRIGTATVGFLVCEDAWNPAGTDYALDPFSRLADASPDFIVSINASPSSVGKAQLRHEIFGPACARHHTPLVYVNQVGGHDQLVYDGASFVMDGDGRIVAQADAFKTAVLTVSFDPDSRRFVDSERSALVPIAPQPLPASEFYRRQIVLGLRDYARRCGFKSVVVGSSGGIDSALTLALAVEALGPDRVVAVTMPSDFSSRGSVDDSTLLCRNLGITLLNHSIAPLVLAHKTAFEASSGVPLAGLALENIQARIRGTTLMAFSNTFGHLLLTTGNKSELSVGYFTVYGDACGGLGLIGDLYKQEVFALCRHINASSSAEIIPASIIDKPPSAELAPDQRDTDSLPPYELLDEILKLHIEGTRLSRLEHDTATATVSRLQSTDDGRALIRRIQTMISRSEFKRRQAPPVLRVRSLAFGSGRQMPVAAVHY
jgi:NAD+ synthetase